MAKSWQGAEYRVYREINLYWDEDRARTQRNASGKLAAGVYHLQAWNGNDDGRAYAPALPIMRRGVGIGWINENENVPYNSTINSVSALNNRSSTMTVNVTKYEAQYTHRLTLTVNGTFIAQWANVDPNSSGNITVSLTSAHRNKISDAMSDVTQAAGLVMLTTLKSKTDDTTIGATSKAITAFIHTAETPTISAITTSISTQLNISSASSSILVKGFGKVRADFTVTYPRGASYKALDVYWGSHKIVPVYTPSTGAGWFEITPNEAGNIEIRIVSTDTRGRSTVKTKSVTVLDYTPLQAKEVYIGRTTKSNTSQVYAQFTVDITAASVKAGDMEMNKVRVRVQWKDGNSWSTPINQTYGVGSRRVDLTPDTMFDETKAYDVRVIVEDEFKSVTIQRRLETAANLVSLGKTGIGVGCDERSHTALAVSSNGSGTALHVDGSAVFSDITYKGAPIEQIAGASIAKTDLSTNYITSTSPSITISAAAGNVTINFNELVLSTSIGSGRALTMARATAGYRPLSETIHGVILADNKTPLAVSIATGGAIKVSNSSGTLIPSNAKLTGSVSYALA